jgi:pteridine reductase
MKQVALITGAARRVGACIARQLHQQDMNVVIHYNQSGEEAEKLCDDLNKIRAKSAVICQADLAHCASLSVLIDAVIAEWGRLDVLVNNASSFYPTPIGQVTEAEWDDLQASNVKGAFFLAQAAYPHLKKHHGAIINITDIFAQKPLKNYPAYTIAKASLAMMTKVLAREMAPEVRVNAVAPGSIAWPEAHNELTEHQKQEIIERTLLKKHGSPEDIAAAVYFLCESKYITGQTIAVDGGASVR